MVKGESSGQILIGVKGASGIRARTCLLYSMMQSKHKEREVSDS